VNFKILVHMNYVWRPCLLSSLANKHTASEEDYYSDASEGRKKVSRPVTPSSPIPITRVEKVDDAPSHGEVPGTPSYDKRRQDAVPDEVEVMPEGKLSKRSSRQHLEPPLTPGGTPIPITVVEKVDPGSPSHGEVPGTEAYRQRMLDATPDVVLKNPDPTKGSKYEGGGGHGRNTSSSSIPETIVTRVDDEPAHGEVPGTAAAEMRKQDATPDHIEIKSDESGRSVSPILRKLTCNETDQMTVPIDTSAAARRTSRIKNDTHDDNDDNGFGDDFDDFTEGAQVDADDDFGDFDDFEEGIQDDTEAPEISTPLPSQTEQAPSFPLINSSALSDLQDLLETTKMHLDTMFPTTTTANQDETSLSDSIPVDSPIFPNERSRSLWTQLITPPPLQPPNWTQSRIRRLFLISLGVPVDLDEILPPSKQKKLILPDIPLPSRTSTSDDISTKPESNNITHLRSTTTNDSTASIDSQASTTGTATPKPPGSAPSRGRPRPTSTKPGPAPPPSLDLNAVKRLCATTDEKLEGFTDDELQSHVAELKELEGKTAQLLEYWLKRRDGLKIEKEAFEGVIENLVRHAKRVRTIK